MVLEGLLPCHLVNIPFPSSSFAATEEEDYFNHTSYSPVVMQVCHVSYIFQAVFQYSYSAAR